MPTPEPPSTLDPLAAPFLEENLNAFPQERPLLPPTLEPLLALQPPITPSPPLDIVTTPVTIPAAHTPSLTQQAPKLRRPRIDQPTRHRRGKYTGDAAGRHAASAIYHLGRSFGKLKTHRGKVNVAKKVLAGVYALAEIHRLPRHEIEPAGFSVAAPNVPRGTPYEDSGDGVGKREPLGCVPHRGGGGLTQREALEVGLVQGHTTNLIVSSESQVGLHEVAEGLNGMTERFEERVKAEVALSPVEAGLVALSEERVGLSQAQPEGPEWPAWTPLRVLGPCPNPRVWRSQLCGYTGPGEYGNGQVSLEASLTRRWKSGDVVECELVRGGGSPLYREARK